MRSIMNEVRKPEGYSLKVSKVGNSLGVILPKELIARLGLREGDRLEATEQPERKVTLSAYDTKHAEAMALARELMHEYRDTFRELAK
jgi:putative addiction module antidote